MQTATMRADGNWQRNAEDKAPRTFHEDATTFLALIGLDNHHNVYFLRSLMILPIFLAISITEPITLVTSLGSTSETECGEFLTASESGFLWVGKSGLGVGIFPIVLMF